MSVGRRKVRLDDAEAWVFNRMADVYSARPAYPVPLIDALCELGAGAGRRVLDLGSGIGHVALPLSERGFDVTAVDAAGAMLEQLACAARARGLRLEAVHAMAEALPLESGRFDLVVVADALHFLDKELAAAEIRRVLAPRGALALVTSEFAPTAFMRAVVEVMEQAAPRRPRDVLPSIEQVAAVTGVDLRWTSRFVDETPVDRATLERILRSISFIGPAMNAQRFAAFRERIHALPHAPVWARVFTLRAGRRGGGAVTARAEGAQGAGD